MRRPTAQPEEPSLDGLLEEDTDAIPVRIAIVQDGVTTGWDDGALGFEDGAVWFSGRATSFHLAAPDILPGAYLLSRREPVTSGEALNQGFPLRHPTREIWVRVRVLTEDEEGKVAQEARLIEGVKRLRMEDGSPWSEARAEGGSNSGWKTVGEGVLRGDVKVPASSSGFVPQVEGMHQGGEGSVKLSSGVVSQVERGEGSGSEYPPLVPRPGLLGPWPRHKSPEEIWRLRRAFAVGAVGCVAINFLLTAIHVYPSLANLAGIMVFPCIISSVAGMGDVTDEERRTLRRIADEEAEPSPVRLSAWH